MGSYLEWIYLSPHFDDVVLSCGGLLWEQAQRGERVQIWTICAGSIPAGPLSPFADSLHARWQTGTETIEIRRAEDQAACQILGAEALYFDLPDCIYRRTPSGAGEHLYASEDALFGELHPAETARVHELAAQIRAQLPPGAILVSPLALGGHVDHQLVRQAAEVSGIRWHYSDYPYVLEETAERRLASLSAAMWQKHVFPVSSAGLQAWQSAVEIYASQLSTFWHNRTEMRAAIQDYAKRQGGVVLWER